MLERVLDLYPLPATVADSYSAKDACRIQVWKVNRFILSDTARSWYG